MSERVKLVVPVDRRRYLDQVIEERIGGLLKEWNYDQVLGVTSFIRLLIHSTEAWDKFLQWRTEARAEGLRRYDASGEAPSSR